MKRAGVRPGPDADWNELTEARHRRAAERRRRSRRTSRSSQDGRRGCGRCRETPARGTPPGSRPDEVAVRRPSAPAASRCRRGSGSAAPRSGTPAGRPRPGRRAGRPARSSAAKASAVADQQAGQVGPDVHVLVDDLGRVDHPRVADVGQHEVDVRVIDRHVVDQQRVGELQLGLRRVGVAGVEDERQLVARGQLVVAAGSSGVSGPKWR